MASGDGRTELKRSRTGRSSTRGICLSSVATSRIMQGWSGSARNQQRAPPFILTLFHSSVDKIKEIMRIKRIGAYVGIDPTAESLHVGHLLPLMPLFWMWFHGYPATTLVGGGTARIGDPTGRLTTREAMSNSEISKNIFKIHIQLSKLWHNAATLRDKYGFEKDWAAKHRLLNNNMWLQGLTMYEFTKRIANHTRLGPMLSRETQVSPSLPHRDLWHWHG